MCEIVMLIFGIIALVRGKFSLTRKRIVEGVPARIIGVFLILPLPLSLIAGLAFGAGFLAVGKPVEGKELETIGRIVEFAIVAVCFLTALGIAMATAHPPRPKRRADDDFYDDNFPPERRERRDDDLMGPFGDRSRDEGHVEEPPRRRQPPDDRFRERGN
jgi:hypothetical protein